MKTVVRFSPAKCPVFAHTSLGNQSSPNNAFMVGEFCHVELCFNRVPMPLERFITCEFLLNLIVFVACTNERFVIAMLHCMFVFRNSASRSATRHWRAPITANTHCLFSTSSA